MTRLDRSRVLLACLITGAMLLLVFPAVAAGHAELETSSPADGATIPSPFDGPIVLGFSAALAAGSKADLLDPAGATIASATVDGPGAKMTFTLDTALAAGGYQVKWTTIAEDTDVARGTIHFTVAPASPTASPNVSPSAAPTAVETAPPSAGTPSTAPTSSAASAPPSATPPSGSDTSGGGGDVVLPIVVALIGIGAGAVYLLSRRNRPTTSG